MHLGAAPVMMLEDDDELSAMAAEARATQEWLANMRKVLAEEERERAAEQAAAQSAPRVTTHFARDEWGAPIVQELADAMYLERRIHATSTPRERADSPSDGESGAGNRFDALGGSAGSSRSSRSVLPPIR